MIIRLYSNEIEAPLTSFIGKFLGHVCLGIVSSLKTPAPVKSLELQLIGDDVRLDVNNSPVALDLSQGFSKVIIRDTIRGMIRHLKMADPNGDIIIAVERKEQS
jgi:hypothetical protein